MKKQLLDFLLARSADTLPFLDGENIILDFPKQSGHGDLSTNIAMVLSKKLRKKPVDIATDIIQGCNPLPKFLEKIEIAGPGFINFFFTNHSLSGIVSEVLSAGDMYGKSNINAGKRANIEFVSANPTGPLTVGHGRNAVIGDTIANILEWTGYEVDREYYFNNAGRQMRVLGDSVRIRYLELFGEIIEFPADYYQGPYIRDIAKQLKDEYGESLKEEPAEGLFKQRAESVIFEDIKNTLNNIQIKHHIFFNENSLYEEGKISDLLNLFAQRGLSYEKDGAVWLKLSELGNEKDKVIVKSTGEPTYRLPDIAYHTNKFSRGYDLIVDLFGADHNATYPDVMAALRALGLDTGKVKVLIHQFVTILRNGEIQKISTRKANYVTLDELVEEAGADVVRYFFNMRTISSHMNFDLDLAKKQNDENPVFYLQYAHARISSILRMATEAGISADPSQLSELTAEEEVELFKKMYEFPEVILAASQQCEPVVITAYLESMARAFHRFYTLHRIVGSSPSVASARLALSLASQVVIRNGLRILGVSAPDKM